MQRIVKDVRNSYINENYDRLAKLCKRCAYRIQNTFWNASIEDLSAYGMIGVIYALDRMDYTNPGAFKYIELYCLSHTISGAMSMCGLKREKQAKTGVRCLSTAPYDLVRLQEEIQIQESAYGRSEEDKSIDRLDFECYLNISPCQTTREIIRLLSHNKSFDEISELLQIPKRTVRRRIVDANSIWEKRRKFKVNEKRLGKK